MADQQLLPIASESTSKIESYEFDWEPIRGYPELRWAAKRPFRSTRFYPAQKKETYGNPVDGWMNRIFWGDNREVMSHLLKEFRGSVRLVYIDPPFDSKADYKRTIRLRGNNLVNDHSAFEEKQYNDIWLQDDYLQFIYERLIIIRELMSDHSSIYIHLDSRRHHQVRSLLDEVFGYQNYRSEIIWKRTSARSDSRGFNEIHDYLVCYSKNEDPVFNQQYTPYSEEYVEKFYRYVDKASGRRYTSSDLMAAGLRNGSSGLPWRGINPQRHGNHWKFAINTLDELDAAGKIHWPDKEGGIPRYKRYLDEMPGRPLQSIWTDINAIGGQSNERTGYPTQKPEALLERIIRASSNPGDLVFDCFMGSGTTQAVAMKLGRRFIGADINLGAIDTTKRRLINVAKQIVETPPEISFEGTGEDGESEEKKVETFYTGFEYYVVNHYDVFRNPDEARDILLKALEAEILPKTSLFHGRKDGRLVYITPPNRIATRQDLTPITSGLDYSELEKKAASVSPGKPVEEITLVCMGHEPGLGGILRNEIRTNGFEVDVEVVDVLRDRQDLQFKRESDARVEVEGNELVIRSFYPMNLLAKLSLEKEKVEDWRELVDTVMVDFNYDGAVLSPTLIDIPEKNGLVSGRYPVPEDAGTIRVKITDVLSESWEGEVV